ncbi:pyrroloquinoline quinone biosynthesis peptide chaperone PqqD [Caballeronia novacaledonica]|uniref:pyrroloquinoline quinone biosynthesis peptide chaperone PqqD n=1 Tax=Caballeronia TaxID=1827195 RepID=UPI001EE272E0|nr:MULTISPECIES: pyrroloquinoline quinone biosynthesis peptide chaperone PqqD [Caballeronia]MDR5745527.1 pyrroloquinoline quinone biosynthesis peptide chaperone PqqD [Caballeronia sp. LZ029]GJH10702.1 pyrroloquinoline quinone biosynthesis peptide chaperone PqqD [Caballeronia novacaledonica]
MNPTTAHAGAPTRPRLRAPLKLHWHADMSTCEIVHPSGSVELNRSAGEILARCDGTRELDDIIGELEVRFGMEGLAVDVYRFIDEARRLGWLC